MPEDRVLILSRCRRRGGQVHRGSGRGEPGLGRVHAGQPDDLAQRRHRGVTVTRMSSASRTPLSVGAGSPWWTSFPMIVGRWLHPQALFAFTHSLTRGHRGPPSSFIITTSRSRTTHPDPVIRPQTVKLIPLLVLVAVLVCDVAGSPVGGLFGGFVAALLASPARRGAAGPSSGSVECHRPGPGTPGTAARAG